MFGVKGNSVFCFDCNERAIRKKDYMEDLNRDDPEYFYEPWDSSEYHLFVCRKCKNEDFIS